MKIRTLEISELNIYINKLINDDPILNNIRVRGEVSNFKIHSSGNVYLTLKDDKSKVNCMVYKTNYNRNLKIENGSKIIAEGYVSSYVRDGIYQLYIKSIELEGKGNLYLEFLKLKEKLEKEGIFDHAKKRNIPKFPQNIGVVTSPTGAVIKDIINVISRRYPRVNIKLYPALVQGEGSAITLKSGIEFFNNLGDIDTIIIGRGGGSLEELWSFNDEELARTIYKSTIPVISAVGHETDFTICDFVSDMRAPTPSAAAEIATPNEEDLISRQYNLLKAMGRNISSKMNIEKHKLKSNFERYNAFVQKTLLNDRYMDLDRFKERLDNNINLYLKVKREELNVFASGIGNLNPFSVLERGYCIVEKNDNILSSISNLEINDKLELILNDGKILCNVEDIFD
ncbi:exodeoxyribonuclease VII large subunit [Peptostreptococcus canis]|uniref:Exodeoxyribonuclease 7 large subunit n=1 Tax=Peptostreptococcus canis TaxID=1159213 RepID=A0ABR6TM48_9FIRM|nr:exodeoxyribonuclease VII large subunit [Peptostreptococcus canis]MBC2576495.1 exodeoxyribonuclease VII large subunit [Peptostreptococcus canis]MBP1998669.1 exodeoxyribonuclease VII large subunit [Peptostreptococcus canis]